jgi:hypothetical protein
VCFVAVKSVHIENGAQFPVDLRNLFSIRTDARIISYAKANWNGIQADRPDASDFPRFVPKRTKSNLSGVEYHRSKHCLFSGWCAGKFRIREYQRQLFSQRKTSFRRGYSYS